MNINFASFLQGSMKILNIVNKSLPLVKEFNPTISKMVNKLKSNNNVKFPIMLNNRPIPNKSIPPKRIVNNSNSLTFFR